MQIICEQTRESSLAISHAIGYNNKAEHPDCLYMDRYRSPDCPSVKSIWTGIEVGSEPKRRRWRKKRGERVAVVEIPRARASREFRAPQQDITALL